MKSGEVFSTSYAIYSPDKLIGNYKCPTCVHRNLSLRSATCQKCIFRKESPNYKEDVRITNLKLDSFQNCKCDD